MNYVVADIQLTWRTDYYSNEPYDEREKKTSSWLLDGTAFFYVLQQTLPLPE